MAYTAGQAAYDLALLAGWTLAGIWGAFHYWSTHGSQGVTSGCPSDGWTCE